jgi:thioredoxin 1
MSEYVKSFLNDDEFYDTINSEKLVVVDFYAEWCGPCKMIAPIFERVAKKYDGKVHFYKINSDYMPNIAATYQVYSLPTLLFFRNGEVVHCQNGLLNEVKLSAKVNNLLESKVE